MEPQTEPDRPSLQQREQRLAYWLLGPPLCIVFAVVLLPVLWNFWLSLQSISLANLGSGALWNLGSVSLDNFARLLTSSRFYRDTLVTVVYSTVGVGLSLLFGLAAALLLNQPFPGRSLLRGLYLFPYIAPVVAVAYVSWTWMLDPASGVISWGLQRLGVIEGPVGFLTEQPYALLSIIFFQTWRYGPFCMLFILARLQSIPEVLYEAAEVDGMTPFQKFFNVTLPQLRGVLATLFLLRFMWTFNKFDDVYLLTGGSGGTEVLPILLFNVFIGQKDLGRGAALAVVLFLLLAVFLYGYFRWIAEEW